VRIAAADGRWWMNDVLGEGVREETGVGEEKEVGSLL
jgi:hypothetical protein